MTDAERIKLPRGAGKAQHAGKEFEEMFEAWCDWAGVACTRTPDGCKQLGRHIARVKTPWDFVLSYFGKHALIDTKSTESRSFPNSGIEWHQVEPMLEHAQHGTTAGYIIWARSQNLILFAPAALLAANYRVKGSIDERNVGIRIISGAHVGAHVTPLAMRFLVEELFR